MTHYLDGTGRIILDSLPNLSIGTLMRKSFLVPSVVLFLSSLASLASAQSSSPGPKNAPFKTVYTLSGKCTDLLVLNLNYAGVCSRTLFRMIYPGGREAFSFAAKGKALVSFSGFPKSDSTGVSVLDVDHVTVTSGTETAPKAEPHNSTGSCVLSVPGGSRFAVRCIGLTQQGRYRGSFISDGTRPVRVDF